MKTKLTIALLALSLTACNMGKSFQEVFLIEAVRNEAGEGSQVMRIPGEKFKFLAKKADGSVWYYECMGLGDDTKPTASLVIFSSPAPYQEKKE